MTSGAKSEKLNITLKTNQSSHEDLNGATITVTYADQTVTHTWDGSVAVVEVPAYVDYNVAVSAVTDYSTPASYSGTAVPDNSLPLTFTYNTTVITASIKSNQSSTTDIADATVTIGSKTLKNGESAKFATGSSLTATFSAVSGYKKPDNQTVATSGASLTVEGTYQTCVVTVSITDNQTSYNDISGAKATVTGSASATLSSGGTVKVPWGGSVTVTGSSVTGYSTPSATASADAASKTVTLTYATEILTLKMATDGATPTGYTLTVKTSSGTTLATQTTATGTHKIPYGTSYYVTASAVTNFTTPSNSSTYTASSASNASRTVTMTYQEIKNETLTVTVSGISSGFTVYVKNSSGTTLGSQTTTSKTYSITAGTKYYVTASDVSGYIKPSNSSTYTAVAGNTRSVTMKYTAHAGTTSPSNGVYIQDTDGFFHTVSAWSGTYTPNGIAVLTDNCQFVIALEDARSSSCRWGGYGTTVSGITTTTSESTAQKDFDGKAQTTTIINALKGTNDGYVDGAPAAEYCRAYTFPDGSTGYLGAAGEWQAALDNKSAIESALSKCGGESLSNYCWTSTQYSSNSSWSMAWYYEVLGNFVKSSSYSVRAFAAI